MITYWYPGPSFLSIWQDGVTTYWLPAPHATPKGWLSKRSPEYHRLKRRYRKLKGCAVVRVPMTIEERVLA